MSRRKIRVNDYSFDSMCGRVLVVDYCLSGYKLGSSDRSFRHETRGCDTSEVFRRPSAYEHVYNFSREGKKTSLSPPSGASYLRVSMDPSECGVLGRGPLGLCVIHEIP